MNASSNSHIFSVFKHTFEITVGHLLSAAVLAMGAAVLATLSNAPPPVVAAGIFLIGIIFGVVAAIVGVVRLGRRPGYRGMIRQSDSASVGLRGRFHSTAESANVGEQNKRNSSQTTEACPT